MFLNVRACNWLLLTLMFVQQAIMDYFPQHQKRSNARALFPATQNTVFPSLPQQNKMSSALEMFCFI